MNRRRLLLGMGTTAAGAGAVFGSGAFTQVEAERSLTIGIDEDSSALLQLTPGSGVGSVSTDGNGQLVIDTTKITDSSNQGFSVGSTVLLGKTDNGIPSDPSSATVSDDDAKAAFKLTNNFETVPGDDDDNDEIDIAVNLEDVTVDSNSEPQSDITFIGTVYDGESTGTTEAVAGGSQAVFNDVAHDSEIYFAILLETASTTNPEDIEGTVRFRAGPNLANEFPTDATVSDDGVVNVTQDTTHTSIQDAVDGADQEDLIQVGGESVFGQVTIDVDDLTLEAAEDASPTIKPGNDIDAIAVSANNVTVDGFSVEIGVNSGEATAVDLSGLSSGDSVTLTNNSFDADGAEGETYVFDPNGTVDLDAVEDANSFAGPAPVTGEVAINPNQPDAYDFDNADGDGRIDRGGVAVEQTDGTLVVLEPNVEKNYDETLNKLFNDEDTLLYVSNSEGSVTLNAQARQQDNRATAAYIYEPEGKGDALSVDGFNETLGNPDNTQIPEIGTNYYPETYGIQEGQLIINWNTEPEVSP